MEKILILKTASDIIVDNLLEKLLHQNNEKICMIQTSARAKFEKKYPNVKFIDIKKEGFYEIADEILQPIQKMKFERIYIPTTGTRANNFGNILKLCNELNFKELFFYNSNGEGNIVKKKTAFTEWMIKNYIELIEFFYKK